MSDETVVETGGVTVSKSFNAEDFPVPAVAFDVESSLDDAATVRIVDEIPDAFGIDQIGFHPEYGSEHWTASGDGVVRFEREVDPGEEFTTVYGVRMEDDQDETPFLSAPEVEVAGGDIDDVVPPESTSVVRELAGGERDTVPGLEDDADVEEGVEAGGAEDGIEAEAAGVEADESGVEADADTAASLEGEDAEILEGDIDLGEPEGEPGLSADAEPPGESDEAEPAGVEAEDESLEEEPPTEPEAEGYGAEQPEPPMEEGGVAEPEAEGFDEETGEAASGETAAAAGAEGAAAAGFDAGDVAGALAEAIRNDEVSDDDLETLEEAFGGVPNSTQVEIEHLQSRVSELEAYTDALEAFIDEEGTAQQVLSDVEDDVNALSEELSDVEESLESVEAGVEDAADDRETIRERVADVEDDLAAVDDLEDDLERLRGDVDALDERVEDTEEAVMEVDEIEADLSQLSDVFGA